MAPTLSRVRYLWLVLPLVSGCAGVPARVESYAPPVPARGIVIVADGAGGYPTASRSITAAAEQCRLPLFVRTFDWSNGRLRPLADMRDGEHSRCQAEVLACEVNRYRASYPGVPISLVGFSAGSVVVLGAAERLPANALERIVLLAPAVSTAYDLRRALLSARGGMDVFTSQRDRLWLGLGTGVVGTADGTRDPAAGRVGFQPPALCPGELALAGRLRQHPWDPGVAWTGNEGGHSGTLGQTYLKAYVVPLLTSWQSLR
jgi:pimeloyl-ACP methyl ester carboxylesterase